MTNSDRLKTEIAQKIAYRIAMDCCDWQTSRQTVWEDVRQTYGKIPANAMPNSSDIETAVRECFALFAPEEHSQILQRKRLWAKKILERFSNLDIYLTGAVLNGCATSESNICFVLFTDDVKTVEAMFIDMKIDFEIIEPLESSMPKPLECIGFLIYDRDRQQTEGVRIDIYDPTAKKFNPFKKTPDKFQQTWESLGRISLEQLVKNVHFDN